MNLKSIVKQARDSCENFRIVDYALTLEALKSRGIPALPALFVLPVKETATPNSLATGAHHQQTTWRWRGYLYIKSAKQDLGESLDDELKPHRDKLLDAWLGYQPDGADGTTNFDQGSIVGLESGVLIWADDYYVTSHYRKLS